MAHLASIAAALIIWALPLGVRAETRIYRLGLLSQGSPLPSGYAELFWPALRDLGYVEAQNLVIDVRYAEGRNERFPSLATELVALKPDAIVASSTTAAVAAMRATATIPIVIVNVSDPVGSGLVASLARPGRNITGTTDFGTELAVKQVDILHSLAPKATRIAVVMSDNPVHPVQLEMIQGAGKSLGLTVLPTIARSPEEFEGAFASMAKQKAGAFILLGGAPFVTPSQRATILQFAAKTKSPAVYPSRMWVDAGGLLSYGPSLLWRWRQTAIYVDKILKGAKPSELPVQQPTEFELIVNLKTAKLLGLTIPRSLLVRTDYVIE